MISNHFSFPRRFEQTTTNTYIQIIRINDLLNNLIKNNHISYRLTVISKLSL